MQTYVISGFFIFHHFLDVLSLFFHQRNVFATAEFIICNKAIILFPLFVPIFIVWLNRDHLRRLLLKSGWSSQDLQGLKFLYLFFEDLKIGLKLVAFFGTWPLFTLSNRSFGMDSDSFSFDKTVFVVIFISELDKVVNFWEWLNLKVLSFESSGRRCVLFNVLIGGIREKEILITWWRGMVARTQWMVLLMGLGENFRLWRRNIFVLGMVFSFEEVCFVHEKEIYKNYWFLNYSIQILLIGFPHFKLFLFVALALLYDLSSSFNHLGPHLKLPFLLRSKLALWQ